MNVVSHLLLTTVAIQTFGLQGKDMLLAYTFGNAIDLDHAFTWFKQQHRHKSWLERFLTEKSHTIVHEPIFILPITTISFLLQSFLPLLFWSFHILIDHVILRSSKRPGYPWNKNWYTYGLFSLNHRLEYFLDATLILVVIWLYLTAK